MTETQQTRVQLLGRASRYLGVVALGFATLGIGLGCESQADPSYRGEPLMSVTGKVEAALSMDGVEVGILWLTTSGDFDLVCSGEVETVDDEPSECAAACGELSCATVESWAECLESCADVTGISELVQAPPDFFVTGGIGQTTPAVGEFPAQFSLDILEPPPPSALIGSKTGEKLAIGLFVALDPAGAPFQLDSGQPELPDWLLGSSFSHVLMFAPEGVPEGSTWSTLGFTLGPGYQLMQLVPAECEPPEEECEGVELQPAPDASADQVSLRIGPPIALPLLDP